MNNDWQSYAALGVVVITAVLLLRTKFRKKSSSGCGTCGCSSGQKAKPGSLPGK